jgi:hypothetical protein
VRAYPRSTRSTHNDVVFDSAILGEWVEANSKDNSLTFIKADDNGYKLIQGEGSSKKTAYLAHLVKLTGKLFLDIEPDPQCGMRLCLRTVSHVLLCLADRANA